MQLSFSIIGFILLPIFVRDLSTEIYGQIAFEFSLAQMLATILLFGTDHALEQNLILGKKTFRKSIFLSLSILIPVGMLGLLVLIAMQNLGIVKPEKILSVTLIFIVLAAGILALRIHAAYLTT